MSLNDYSKVTQVVTELRKRCKQLESEVETLMRLQKITDLLQQSKKEIEKPKIVEK